ncbi:50S ribosomal protein L25/general stress protein Ctc [Eisenibacter elegans]|jgi:large subunit ribosomal protein L25|uniref:50S ribosomal protein L25/general stress protein Ctc n=1 Tax=Eisenibacter elegans TaxID=997 RepID=UPI00041CC1C2|nr:50S ribosomal protein L25/general stress protein Ctc [Eisenibacter elegans]
MKKVEIIGYKRANLGKAEAKRLRNEGLVPGVLYGGEQQVHFYSPMILFREVLYTPEACIVTLNIEGDIYECVLQEAQFHPVSEVMLHVDFLQIFPDKPVKMAVPITTVGVSPGVQAGGKLVYKMRKMRVKALPAQLPDTVQVDISELELGKSIKVREIAVEGYEILDNMSNPVVSIDIPRALRGKMGANAQ